MTSAQIAIMTTIILYLCLVIFTGVMIGKRSKKSAEGFYLGGRGMGPLVTAMSAEASDMSSYLLMGIPGLAYLSGVADASWTAIGLAIGTYLNFLLVARRLRRYSVELDAITIPSFISKRYGEKKPIIMGIASLIILVFFVPYVASGLAAIGKLFNSLFGWNYMLSVIVGAIVIISYTSVGGFSAVATMDLIQSVIMTVALCVIVVFGIAQAAQALLLEISGNKYIFLLIVNVIFLIAGCFVDANSAMYIFIPIMYPVATQLGIDPVHFGVIATVNLAIGQVTPPVGVNLFVAIGVSEKLQGLRDKTKVTIVSMSKAVWPQIVACIIALLLITYVPWFSTVLLFGK